VGLAPALVIRAICTALFPTLINRPFYIHRTGRKILSNIDTLFASISGHMKSIPVGTMADTIAALATARLPAKIHLLAVGDEIVHLLTVSPMYVSPKAPHGSSPIAWTIEGIS
jgi:hypothetical protein